MMTIWHMFAISFVAKVSYTDRLLNTGPSRTWHRRMGSEIDCYGATVSAAL